MQYDEQNKHCDALRLHLAKKNNEAQNFLCTNNQIISHNLLHSVTESPRTTNDKSDLHVKKSRNLMNNDDNINEKSNKNKNERPCNL